MGDIIPGAGHKWWEEDEPALWKSLTATVKYLLDRQRARQSDDWRHARLFSGMRPDLVTAFGALGYISASAAGPSRLPRFTFNVIESVIETLASRIAANEIRPVCVTDGGDWEMQEKGEALTDFLDGTMRASNWRAIALECAIDAMVFGTGIAKIFEEKGSIKSERCFPLEWLFDDLDGVYRKPRSGYQVRGMSRSVCEAHFGDTAEKRAKIRSAPLAKKESKEGTLSDQILVCEGWHLPSGSRYDEVQKIWVDADDGTARHRHRWRHVVHGAMEEGGVPRRLPSLPEPHPRLLGARRRRAAHRDSD